MTKLFKDDKIKRMYYKILESDRAPLLDELSLRELRLKNHPTVFGLLSIGFIFIIIFILFMCYIFIYTG